MQLTTKLHKRVEHQADYNCGKFQGRRLNESKDTEVKQRDLWKTAKQGEKDISEASSPQFWPISAKYWI